MKSEIESQSAKTTMEEKLVRRHSKGIILMISANLIVATAAILSGFLFPSLQVNASLDNEQAINLILWVILPTVCLMWFVVLAIFLYKSKVRTADYSRKRHTEKEKKVNLHGLFSSEMTQMLLGGIGIVAAVLGGVLSLLHENASSNSNRGMDPKTMAIILAIGTVFAIALSVFLLAAYNRKKRINKVERDAFRMELAFGSGEYRPISHLATNWAEMKEN